LPLEGGSPGEIAMHQQNESGSAIATLDTPGAPDVGRRNLLKMTGVGITSLSVGTVSAAHAVAQPQIQRADKWDKTFARSDKVAHQKASFKRPGARI
jgi:hypothetical protein